MKKVMSEMRYGRCVCERETERQLDKMRVDEIEGENFQEKGRQYILALLRSQPYQSLYDMHINYAANNTIKRDGTKGPGPRLAMFYRGASSNLLNILCFFFCFCFCFFCCFCWGLATTLVSWRELSSPSPKLHAYLYIYNYTTFMDKALPIVASRV